MLIIAIAFTTDSYYFLYSMTVLNGFFTNAGMPLCYEIITETTYPLSEAMSAGFVHTLYSLIRLALKGLNKALDTRSQGVKSYSYCFIMILLIFSSFVLMFFAKIRHKRLRMEVRHARKIAKKALVGETSTF